MTHVEFPGLGLAFDVNPVAFTIGSFEFRWYGILIALGFILAFLYALKICKRYQVNQDLSLIHIFCSGRLTPADWIPVCFSLPPQAAALNKQTAFLPAGHPFPES